MNLSLDALSVNFKLIHAKKNRCRSSELSLQIANEDGFSQGEESHVQVKI